MWIVSLLRLLSVASGWGSQEASLGWWRVLVWVTLLLVLWDMNYGNVGPRSPPPAVHAVRQEDGKDDHETGNCDANTSSGAESVPANYPTETNGGGQLRGDWGGKWADAS